MKLIGAGLPRTATTTQLIAFEQLGYAGCYHMRNILTDMENELPKWERFVAGEADWESIIGGFNSCCDWPSAFYYRELAERYPDAKVVLTVRSPEGWVRSMRETLWSMYYGDSVMKHTNAARELVNPLWHRYLNLVRPMTFFGDGPMAGAETASEEEFGAMMTRWNDEVKATIPPDRLLVWDPADGWEPLCAFLGVAVPAGPVPRVNDTAGFKEGIIGGAIADIDAWWDRRERPSSGLHGAELKE